MFNLRNLSLLLVVAIVSIFTIVNVNASVSWNNNTNTATITREVTSVPYSTVTNTFGYTITADANNPAGATGAPTTASIVMNNQAVTGSGAAAKATKSTTVDFSSMTFAHPGTYNYTITETSSTDSTTYPLDNSTYTVTIFVENELGTGDVPTGNYIAHLFVKDANNQKVSTADFTSAVPNNYGSIKLTKTTTGNQAETSDYFPVSVKIYAAGTYNITGLTAGSNLCSGVATQTATTTVTGAASNPTAKVICIKHGDQVIIGTNNGLNAIPANTRIDISETAGDYTASYKVNNGSAVSSASLTNHSLAGGSQTTVAYTNNKTSTVPTGVILTILPYVLLIAIVAAGVLVFMNLKKKENELNNKKEDKK